MLGSVGFELTSLVNSYSAWKVTKGYRSAARRARKTVVKGFKDSAELLCGNPEGLRMPVSESERHGVAVLGCRFNEKAEDLPIKKRRFLLRSPSPPQCSVPSPCAEEAAGVTGSLDASRKPPVLESAASADNTSQIVDSGNNVSCKSSKKMNEQCGDIDDFSGISILAAAACSSSLGRDFGYSEGLSGVEESLVQDQSLDISTDNEVRTLSKGLLKEELVTSSEISTGGTSSCVSTGPIGQLSTATAENSSRIAGVFGKGIKDASLMEDPIVISHDVSCTDDDNRPSRDHRLHWDLNVAMDAWERPLEHTDVHSDVANEISEDAGKGKSTDGMDNSQFCDLQDAQGSISRSDKLPCEPRVPARASEKNIVDHYMNDSCNPDETLSLCNMSLLSDCKSLGDVKFSSGDCESIEPQERVNPEAIPVASVSQAHGSGFSGAKQEDASLPSIAPCSEEESLNIACASNLACNIVASSAAITEEVGAGSSEIQISLQVSSGFAIEKEKVSPYFAVSDKSVGQGSHIPIMNGEKAEMSRDLRESENFLLKEPESSDLQEHQLKRHILASAGKGFSQSLTCSLTNLFTSTRCEPTVALDTKFGDVDNVKVETEVHDGTTMNASQMSLGASRMPYDPAHHGTCKTDCGESVNRSGDTNLKQPRGTGYGAEDYCLRSSVVETEPGSMLHEEYDSQYEDGELREPIERTCEEVDGEAECVDYGSENGETCSTSAADFAVSEAGQGMETKHRRQGIDVNSTTVSEADNNHGAKSEKVTDDEGGHFGKDNLTRSSHSDNELTKAHGSDELLVSSKASMDAAADVQDHSERKDRVVDSEGTKTRLDSKAFGRGLHSRNKEQVSGDSSSREDRLHKMGSRYENESGLTGSFEGVRYSSHIQARGHRDDSWEGSSDVCQGLRRLHAPCGHGQLGPGDGAMVKVDESDAGGTQNEASYSRQPHSKIDSLADEDNGTGFESGSELDGNLGPDNSAAMDRGRSFRYGPLVGSRGGRGRYHGPPPDDNFQSSLKYRRPLCRRSFSPVGRRGFTQAAHQAHGRSPSRSRSRSPNTWHSPRGRSGAGNFSSSYLRNRSRSPNFRSEVGMQRMRSSPHYHPGFEANHIANFRCMGRNNDSPPRNRWVNSRKDDFGHFREPSYKQRSSFPNRSPGRVRLRGDRMDVMDSPPNPRPDGYYRSMHSGRFDMDGVVRRVRYQESYDDRRKQYGLSHAPRYGYADDIGRRVRHDVEDSFMVPNSVQNRGVSNFNGRGPRGIDTRIGEPRRFRDEQHSFMYNKRDGKFSPNARDFRFDAIDSTRNLKPGQHYRSFNPGRFSDMEGSGRRSRYEENYNDRRKHYGPFHLARRHDIGDGGKRLNHNIDEDLAESPCIRDKGTSDVRTRGTRVIDSCIGDLPRRDGEDEHLLVHGQEEASSEMPKP